MDTLANSPGSFDRRPGLVALVGSGEYLPETPTSKRACSRADPLDSSNWPRRPSPTDMVSRIDGAGLIYPSGGDPGFLADTWRDTHVWEAIDTFSARIPDLATRFLVPNDPSVTVIGVDEQTAIVGGPEDWVVQGYRSAWV